MVAYVLGRVGAGDGPHRSLPDPHSPLYTLIRDVADIFEQQLDKFPSYLRYRPRRGDSNRRSVTLYWLLRTSPLRHHVGLIRQHSHFRSHLHLPHRLQSLAYGPPA